MQFQPIDSAPVDRPVRVITKGGFVLTARLTSGFVNELGKNTFGWVAEDGQRYPECWDDGVCWESNAAGNASDYPVQWANLPPETPADGST